MNILNFISNFFSDSAHWHGYDGIPTRVGEHVQYTLEALALAAAIGVRPGSLALRAGAASRDKLVTVDNPPVDLGHTLAELRGDER